MGSPAEKNQAADYLLTKCLNPRCGHIFHSRNPILVTGNSRDIKVRGTKVNCERCGALAIQQDWDIDGQGKFKLRNLLNDIRQHQNVAGLVKYKERLEQAANEPIGSDEVVEVLQAVDPKYAQFKTFLSSLSKQDISIIIGALTLLATIWAIYLQAEANEIGHEGNSLQKSALTLQERQLELDREKFEFEKHKFESEKSKSTPQKEIAVLEAQLDEFFNSMDKSLNASSKTKKGLKGNLRNKPCPCGSGVKSKKCHPNGC